MSRYVESMFDAPTKRKSTNPVTPVTGGGEGYYTDKKTRDGDTTSTSSEPVNIKRSTTVGNNKHGGANSQQLYRPNMMGGVISQQLYGPIFHGGDNSQQFYTNQV